MNPEITITLPLDYYNKMLGQINALEKNYTHFDLRNEYSPYGTELWIAKSNTDSILQEIIYLREENKKLKK
jgi:hypothetical protein